MIEEIFEEQDIKLVKNNFDIKLQNEDIPDEFLENRRITYGNFIRVNRTVSATTTDDRGW